MKLIYRVETNEPELAYRKGPYLSNLAYVALVADESQNTKTHPNPSNDAGLYMFWAEVDNYREYYFGFDSLEQYKNWFMYEEGRKNMIGQAVVAVYEVPDEFYVRGQFQAIAKHKEMVHLHDLCPLTLEKI